MKTKKYWNVFGLAVHYRHVDSVAISMTDYAHRNIICPIQILSIDALIRER